MLKHTPGPWEMPGQDGGDYVVCTHRSRGKRRSVAHIYNEADARLIAAAPDMLIELIDCYTAMKANYMSVETTKQIIERATGQSIDEIMITPAPRAEGGRGVSDY